MSASTYAAAIYARYPWITELSERRSDDSFDDSLVVGAEDGEEYVIKVDQRRAGQLAHVYVRLDEITRNREVAADTGDWTDAP